MSLLNFSGETFAEWAGDIDLVEWREKAQEIVDNALIATIKTKVDEIVETAKELSPVATGKMRDAIVGQVSTEGHFGKVRVPWKTVPYAFLVHFGTKKMKARPFLYQAQEQCCGTLASDIKGQIVVSED